MIKTDSINDLAEQLTNALPEGLKQFQSEMEKNFRAVIHSAFSKMDLVSREEFEVQSAVLARSRAKLEELEQQLEALGKQVKE